MPLLTELENILPFDTYKHTAPMGLARLRSRKIPWILLGFHIAADWKVDWKVRAPQK